MPNWLKTGLAHLGTVLAVLGIIAILGSIAKPHAQQFVEETVKERIGKLEDQMDAVQRSLTAQSTAQAVMNNDLDHMQEQQAETRENTRMILRSLQGLRREIRE